ncbi:unnamed protein product [Phytomonas sp. EM1]|nr:unnamed protein product [Phytomonas sp. EM1]|eukprot:CCW61893.1 unnamed protein product [Phytomonas sp. isolate EM1]
MNFDLFEDDLKDIRPVTAGINQNQFLRSEANPSSNAATRTSLPATADTASSLLKAIPPRPVAGRRAAAVASALKSPSFPVVSHSSDNHKTTAPVLLNTTSSSMMGAALEIPKRTGMATRSKTATLSASAFEEEFGSSKEPFDILGWGSPPETHRTHHIIDTIEHTEVDAAAVQRAAEVEKQRTEMRSLYASLDAISAEIKELDDKLDTRQAKEEAEVTELSTAKIMKSIELEEQERQLGEACEAVRRETTCRLDAMSDRYSKEMTSLTQNTRIVESERYKSQLQHLQESLLAASKSVTEMRHKRALLIRTDPYTPKGISLALSVAKEGGVSEKHGTYMPHQRDDDSSAFPEAVQSSMDSSLPAPIATSPFDMATQQQGQIGYPLKSIEEPSRNQDGSFESLIHTALSILQGYYDSRLDAIKQHVVDYIHNETFEATHAARTRREKGWFENMADQKQQYGDYITNMMNRHFAWYSQRAALGRESLEALREGVRNVSNQLKEESKQRLSRLTVEVSDKVRRALDQFEQNVSEVYQGLERQNFLTREGDSAIRQAQEAEVEGRCETEASVRRQLWRAELIGLQENLTRMRSRVDRQTRERFEKMRLDATSASNQCGIGSIEAQLKELKGLIQEQILSEQSQRKETGINISQHHSLIAETEQIVRTLMYTARRQKEELDTRHQCCQGLRQRVHENLVETVERLQAGRQVQRSQQSKVDFSRRMWERDHQQNLSASIRLELPVLVSAFSTTHEESAEEAIVGVETHAPSGDITLVYLLQLVADRLRERDARHKKLRTTHQHEWAAQNIELASLGKQYDEVCQLWGFIANMFNELQRTQSSLVSKQVEVHTEAARAKVEGEKLEKERKALVVRHENLEERMMSAKKGLNAALVVLERQKQHLQQLSNLQLHLLQGQHHFLKQQQQLPQHEAFSQPTMATSYGRKQKNSSEQGAKVRGAVMTAPPNGGTTVLDEEKNTLDSYEITQQHQHQQVFHSSLSSVLPAWSTHRAMRSSSKDSNDDKARLGGSATLCADLKAVTQVASSMAVLSPTLQDLTHLPDSAAPHSTTHGKVVAC